MSRVGVCGVHSRRVLRNPALTWMLENHFHGASHTFRQIAVLHVAFAISFLAMVCTLIGVRGT